MRIDKRIILFSEKAVASSKKVSNKIIHCILKIPNIAKGTTDPRIEFILPK